MNDDAKLIMIFFTNNVEFTNVKIYNRLWFIKFFRKQ